MRLSSITLFLSFLLICCIPSLAGAEALEMEVLPVDGFAVDEQKAAGTLHNKITSFEECVAAGNPVMRSMPPKCATSEGLVFVQPVNPPRNLQNPRPICKDLCGNGTCEEMVCMAQGCPCAESKATCPKDCS